MIHIFQCRGERFVFDAVSQALHQIDPLAADVLDAYRQAEGIRPGNAVLNDLAERHGESRGEIDALCDTVDGLIRDDDLFAREASMRREHLYPDGVRIKALCLHLCHDCNLRCRYCFAGTGDFGTGQRSMLDETTGQAAIDFLIEQSGPRHNLDIDFFGGEPLLNWPVVVALTEYVERRAGETGKNIRLTMTTNAYTLDEAKSRYLNEHFANVVLSCDGRPEVHDRMRPAAGGRETYQQTANNIRRFVDLRGDKPYYLRGTFTRYNLDFEQDVLHLSGLGRHVSIEPVVAPPESDWSIRSQDIPEIEAAYERLAGILWEAEDSGEPIDFFHFALRLEDGPCVYKRRKGCGVGQEYMAVTPKGDIYPCHQFVGQERFKLGNVLDRPVRLDAKLQDAYAEILMSDRPDCQVCWARPFCGGGCAANAWHDSGSVSGTYAIGCALQRKRLECALWLLAKRQERVSAPANGSHQDNGDALEEQGRQADNAPI